MTKSTKTSTPSEHYWLVAGQVFWTMGDNVGLQTSLNCIIKTEQQGFGHVHMGKAQQILQMRLMNEQVDGTPPEGFKISDVFLLSVSHLGRMTSEEFEKGFSELASEQSKAEQILEKLRTGEMQAQPH